MDINQTFRDQLYANLPDAQAQIIEKLIELDEQMSNYDGGVQEEIDDMKQQIADLSHQLNSGPLDVNILSSVKLPISVDKGYVEYLVEDGSTIATGALKNFSVDLIETLGFHKTYGLAVYTGQTDSANSKATIKAFSVPRNMPYYSATISSDNITIANSAAFVANYPIQRQFPFSAPKVLISVQATGTVDLTGFKLIVWGMD